MAAILGIWYTGNAAHPHILESSLNSVKKAQNQSRNSVEIIVSSWKKIPDADFLSSVAPSVVTVYNIANHFGIVCQILKVLWERIERKNVPDYLCFLEHDVLYPPHYFDQAAELLDSNIDSLGVFNTNYIGLRVNGFCQTLQRDLPMHQLTAHFSYAVEQFESLLKDYILDRFRPLEPLDKKLFLAKLFSDPSSVHINHNRHLTSHCDTYSKTPFSSSHDFWGDSSKYYPKDM